MVDLDLDVVRHRVSGAAQLLDEDEFEEHQRRYAYPAAVIDRTRAAARWLMEAVTDREPFMSAYRHWLALVTDIPATLPPSAATTMSAQASD